jgi:hypothetical protein
MSHVDPASTATDALSLSVLGQRVSFNLHGRELAALLTANFGAMAVPLHDEPADLNYSENHTGTEASFLLTRSDGPLLAADNPCDFLWCVEKDLTIELQKRRPDLFFVHSAAVEWHGGAYLLVAASGTGKSTTTWALLHHGFRYLSDELSAVDLHSLDVYPYAHALCLKRPPPAPYTLPDATLDLGRTLHVPACALPSGVSSRSRPLAGIFILTRDAQRDVPEIRSMGRAEAAARLYANALNPLAHPDWGLGAAAYIAESVPSFSLSLGELRATCALVGHTIMPAPVAHTGNTGGLLFAAS